MWRGAQILRGIRARRLGENMNDSQANESQRPATLLTISQVAAALNCSTKTVYRLADAGKMPPACRIGDLVRWNSEAIEAWITAGCPDLRNALRQSK